jgi:hypothetical protein
MKGYARGAGDEESEPLRERKNHACERCGVEEREARVGWVWDGRRDE